MLLQGPHVKDIYKTEVTGAKVVPHPDKTKLCINLWTNQEKHSQQENLNGQDNKSLATLILTQAWYTNGVN